MPVETLDLEAARLDADDAEVILRLVPLAAARLSLGEVAQQRGQLL